MTHSKFGELMEQVYEWSAENFGRSQPPSFPLIGVGEEAGELTTSLLKRAQGIDDAEKYEERSDVGEDAEKDALGDIAIYAADFASRANQRAQRGEDIPDDIELLLDFWYHYGSACHHYKKGEITASVAHMSFALNCSEAIGDTKGYEYEACVDEAWREVSGRHWDSDLTGDDQKD